jgi:hypothetical protein
MKMKINDAKKILRTAEEAGDAALKVCVPNPMIVEQRKNMLNDNSPVVNQWYVADGVCGFAWVQIFWRNGEKFEKTRAFISALKRAGVAGSINDGCCITHSDYEKAYVYWVSAGNQSMEKKRAYATAMARVFSDNGLVVNVMSRMD